NGAHCLKVSAARPASPKHSGRWHWITWRGLQVRSKNGRSDFRNKFVTHMARGKSVAGVGRRGTLSSTRGRGGEAQKKTSVTFAYRIGTPPVRLPPTPETTHRHVHHPPPFPHQTST